MIDHIRNIAIIAHIDHGKTTLVDQLLRQSGTFDNHSVLNERVMDSNVLERERGITILSKNTSIRWENYQINIVDTPGHADFGGEVERVLSMVDSVLLLVDAVEGPMPQTRFVTKKAFLQGLNPIVVINKVDRKGARPDWVVNQIFDLFVDLDATDEQLDFPFIYVSALKGFAKIDLNDHSENMKPLFETIIKKVSSPDVDLEGYFQMQVSALDYCSYLGAIGIGRIKRGFIKKNTTVSIIDTKGTILPAHILKVMSFSGLNRVEVDQAEAGDIIAVTGIESPRISDTLCDTECVEALAPLVVEEPRVSMTFSVNSSSFSGRDGDFVTSRQIRDRLDRELITNVALRVNNTLEGDRFIVSGRGELHLSILIETMRREGYELAVSCPEVLMKEIDGNLCEPYEKLLIDLEEKHQGVIMEKISERRGEIQKILPDGKNRVQLEYCIPTRGLIGFHSNFLTLTSGSGVVHHIFDHYGPVKSTKISLRKRGVLIANAPGKATAYALWNLQNRGEIFISPQTEVYEGMIIGLHSKDNDLVVNVVREKKLTNIRAAGSDENILLTPPRRLTLEQALDFIEKDELVEVTPKHIRLRKKVLRASDRRRKINLK